MRLPEKSQMPLASPVPDLKKSIRQDVSGESSDCVVETQA